MARCPICGTPGAYIGFTTVEFRNPDCRHFVLMPEKTCPCCGGVGHEPGSCARNVAEHGAVDLVSPPDTQSDTNAVPSQT
jgi:hypothetical protein